MKYLIVGLGNPGVEYKDTRHNIGYMVLDALIQGSGTIFADKRYGYRADVRVKGRDLILVKPTTFMNLSGNAVRYYLRRENVPIENLLVIVDDIALPLGTIRIKQKGSSGGHNGLQHIEDTIGTDQYNRLRFGIGNGFAHGRQIDYVLGPWTDDERNLLPERLNAAAEAVKAFPVLGIERTMNLFNNK